MSTDTYFTRVYISSAFVRSEDSWSSSLAIVSSVESAFRMLRTANDVKAVPDASPLLGGARRVVWTGAYRVK